MSARSRLRRLAARAASPQFASATKAKCLRFVAAGPARTRMWYVARRAYTREQQAMVAGIAAYHEAEAGTSAGAVYHLRRDIHRIEKGLSVPEQRPTFAEGYVADAVGALGRIAGDRSSGGRTAVQPTLEWAADVLERYFATVRSTPTTEAARRAFQRIDVGGAADGTRVPRPKDSAPPPVNYDDLLALARRRRSVRAFLPEPVPRWVVDAAVNVAGQSPSACNRQAFEFRVLERPDLVEELVELAPGFDAQDRKVPCMIAVVGKYRAYFSERDMHVIYIDASLATMGLVYALESLGYASCCINWPSLPSRDIAISRFLSLEPDEKVVMLLAVGLADPDVSSPFSEKAPVGALRRFDNEW